MGAMKLFAVIASVSAIKACNALSDVQEMKNMAKVSLEYGLTATKLLAANNDSNPIIDAFNVIAGASCLLNAYGGNDRETFFNTVPYRVSYKSREEVLNVFKNINFKHIHTAITLIALSSLYDVNSVYEKFLGEFNYAYLIPGLNFHNDTDSEKKELFARMTNLNVDNEIKQYAFEKLPIDKNTRLLYLHTSSFKRFFQTAFNKNKTRKGKFLNFGRIPKSVYFMTKRYTYKYTKRDDYAALEVPLKNNETLLLILSDQPDDYKRLLQKLDANIIHGIKDSLRSTIVDFAIPKFKVTSAKGSPSLRQHKTYKYLVSESISLTGLSKKQGLHLGNSYAVSTFEMDETGVSYRSLSSVGAGRATTVKFHCKHPFIYAIFTKENMPLIFGFVDVL